MFKSIITETKNLLKNKEVLTVDWLMQKNQQT